jgi:hypothetical protein
MRRLPLITGVNRQTARNSHGQRSGRPPILVEPFQAVRVLNDTLTTTSRCRAARGGHSASNQRHMR